MESVELLTVIISMRGVYYSKKGWSGEDVVRYVQRIWGIHIDMAGKD
jgi:hypothetical protein